MGALWLSIQYQDHLCNYKIINAIKLCLFALIWVTLLTPIRDLRPSLTKQCTNSQLNNGEWSDNNWRVFFRRNKVPSRWRALWCKVLPLLPLPKSFQLPSISLCSGWSIWIQMAIGAGITHLLCWQAWFRFTILQSMRLYAMRDIQ